MNPNNSFYHNTYLYSSNELKKNIMDSLPIMMSIIFVDLVFTIIFSVYNEINLYVFPGILFGITGVWKYYPNLLFFFQMYNITNIYLRCYTIFLTNQAYLITFSVFQFYEIYKFWKFYFELKMLNQNDLNLLRSGWQPNFFGNL